MKHFIFVLLLIITVSGFAQYPNPDYDSVLAKRLGGDERGMKSYMLVILTTGPKEVTAKSERDSLFAGHMKNITRLADEGKLVLAGPLGKNDLGYRGIFILDAATPEAADSMVKADPAVQAKVFDYKIIKWYGSAALPEHIPVHDKITKTISEKKTIMKDTTPRVTGIGGIFFRTKNPSATREWYAKHLGLAINEYGSTFEVRNANRPEEINYLQWSPFNEKTDYFDPSKKEFMINYRVQNIEALIEQLRKQGVTVVGEIQTYDYGKFAHIMDADGNKLELWEPVDHVLTKIGGPTTK